MGIYIHADHSVRYDDGRPESELLTCQDFLLVSNHNIVQTIYRAVEAEAKH